jgi:hypothetical protein
MLVAITLLCEFFDIYQGSVEIGSERELALYISSQETSLYSQPRTASISLWWLEKYLYGFKSNSPINISRHTSKWIYGDWPMMTATQKQERSGRMKTTKGRRWY